MEEVGFEQTMRLRKAIAAIAISVALIAAYLASVGRSTTETEAPSMERFECACGYSRVDVGTSDDRGDANG